MKMLLLQSLRKGLPVLLAAFALSACGPSESQDGPGVFTDNLSTSPASVAVQVPADPANDPDPCLNNPPQSLVTVPVLIIVRNEQGVPLGNVDIDIFLDFAPGSIFGGIPLTTLIDGGAQVAVPYSTTTDDDGSKTVSIGFLVANGCTYAGSLTVTSATLFAQTTFDVTAQ